MSISIQGFTLPDMMEIRNSSETCTVVRNGCRYILKLDKKNPFPASRETMSEKRYEQQLEKCLAFEKKRKRLNEALRRADSGDRVLGYAHEVFLCREKLHPGVFEAVPMVEGGIPWTARKGREDHEWNVQACLAFAEGIARIHEAGILHLDIKPDNMVFTCDSADHVHGTLIDFDQSCFEGEFSAKNGGTPGYQAPEILQLISEEEEDRMEHWQKQIGRPADIFALGASFSALLTGEPPSGFRPADSGSPHDPPVTVWPREKVREEYLRQLIAAMVLFDYRKRPEADAVVASLREKKFLPRVEAYILWPEHSAKWCVKPEAGKEIQRIRTEEFNGEKGYAVFFKSGYTGHYSLNQMINAGILTARKTPGMSSVPAETDRVTGRTAEEDPLRETPILSPEDAKIYDFHPDNLHTRGYRQLLYTPGGYILIDQQGRQTRTAAHVLRLLGILTRKSG